MIGLVLWRLWDGFWAILRDDVPNVNAGIGLAQNAFFSDGSVRILRSDGTYTSINFLVDRPRYLFWPSKRVGAHLFEQFVKMGLVPESITVSPYPTQRHTWRRSELQPLLKPRTQAVLRLKLGLVP